MSAIATAVVAGAAYSSYQNKKAAEKAADAQLEASDANTQLQYRMYEQQRKDLEPWREAGEGALSQMGGFEAATAPTVAEFGRSPEAQLISRENFEQDPGYEFTREEGMRGIENRLSGMGMSNSGRALKELDRYNTGLASQQYGDFVNRQRGLYGDVYGRTMGESADQYNRLATLAGYGQGATSEAVAANQGATSNIMAQNTGAANTQSALAMQQAANQNNLLSQGIQAYGMYQGYQ